MFESLEESERGRGKEDLVSRELFCRDGFTAQVEAETVSEEAGNGGEEVEERGVLRQGTCLGIPVDCNQSVASCDRWTRRVKHCGSEPQQQSNGLKAEQEQTKKGPSHHLGGGDRGDGGREGGHRGSEHNREPNSRTEAAKKAETFDNRCSPSSDLTAAKKAETFDNPCLTASDSTAAKKAKTFDNRCLPSSD